MQNPNDIPMLDALADAIAGRLTGRLKFGPAGEPDLQLPPGLQRAQLKDPLHELVGARVGIAGIEFTQSTQFNGTAGTSYGRDNSVPLVAYKTLVARVYPFVRQGLIGGDSLTGQRVTGDLTLSIGNRVIFQTGPTRIDGARLGPTTQIDRGLWDQELTLYGGSRGVAVLKSIHVNCPLNFIVPGYYCKLGRIHASVRLWPVDDGPMSSRTASTTEYLQFIDVQAPKVCLVRVNWVDGAGNVNSPTDAAMLATLTLAERMLPFPYFQTTILVTEVTSSASFAALASTPGGCNTAWSNLVTDLNLTRIFTALFQLGDIVFGMVPQAAIPAGSGSINSGCGRGAGGGFVGYNSTYAHEIGHLYGRAHVAVPGDTSSDNGYPNYGGSKTSIGEVGIDTGTSPPTLFDSSNSNDIMSYAGNQWISPYTYQAILDARGMHQSAPIDPRRLRPLLVLNFRVYRMAQGVTRVEVRKAARIEAAGFVPHPLVNAFSPLSLDLLDANNRILTTHHCTWIPAHGAGNCGCGCGTNVPLERQPWLDFHEVVEWPADGVASVAFHRGEDPFFTMNVGEPPAVSIAGPERRETELVVRVIASHPRERVSIVVLFSADGGTTWQPVGFDPPNGELVIQTDRLPGGDRCIFRAIGTAELQSATADTEPFDLPRKPRRLYLRVPSGDCGISPGPVALAAMVDTRGLGSIAPQELRWSSDLDGELGFGYALTPDLREGQHVLTVTAPDGIGGTLAERGIIIVGGRPR